MTEADTFTSFITRIRAGDEQAAVELVQRYEPLIRREVRLNLEDRRLARVFDSMDVCQSVLGSFFVRVATGQYELERPDQLIRLLVTMARNKLASQARRQSRQRRDHRRNAGSAEEMANVAAPDPTPSQVVAGKELLHECRRRMNEEERRLAELRGQGLGWGEIAAQLGGSPEARRMQLTRAINRVSQELGLDVEADT